MITIRRRIGGIMKAGEVCTRRMVTLLETDTVQSAARLMKTCHVGSVIVARGSGEGKIPVGIVTDRDIAIGVVAENRDPRRTTVAELVSSELITAYEEDDVDSVVRKMRQRGIRRVPIISREKELVGILSLDDLLGVVTEEMENLAAVILQEKTFERAQEG